MRRGMLFRKSDGLLLKLDPTVVSAIQGYLQRSPSDLEAGGVLMGRRLRKQPHLIIDEVTSPMPGDHRRRHSFSRAQAAHQRILDATWERSGGTCGYLGEWHTHPELAPTPSRVDLRSWRKHLESDEYDGESLYFLILGTEELRIWEGCRSNSLFKLMPRVLSD